MTTLIGFVLGAIGSFLVWYLIGILYLPRLLISLICRDEVEGAPGHYRYRFKIYNRLRRRSAAELSITCRLYIQGLSDKSPKNFTSYYIPVSDQHPYPVIEPRKGRVYTLRIAELQGGGDWRLPIEVQKGIQGGNVTLDELLRLGSSAFLRIAVTAAHEIGFGGSTGAIFRDAQL